MAASEQQGAALADTNSRGQLQRLLAAKEAHDDQWDRAFAEAVLARAKALGPRDMGPEAHREYNLAAVGRELGVSYQAVAKLLRNAGLWPPPAPTDP